MNDIDDNHLPRRLLLATDLTARCDRPLERARQLAIEWRAELTVVVVRQGPGTPEEVSSWLDDGMVGSTAGAAATSAFGLAARAELLEEFAGTGVTPTLQIVEGDVTDGIVGAAAPLGEAVVVIGATFTVPFDQLILGSTAARLVQELAHPLLVVRQRTRGSYARITVATDFGDASRRALETVLRLFPGRPVTLVHVLEDSTNGPVETSANAVQEALARSEEFLARCDLAPGMRGHIRVMVGHGLVAEAIGRHVVEEAIGLVVLGVHRQSAVARVFKGSTSEDLVQQLPCDMLLVRELESSGDG